MGKSVKCSYPADHWKELCRFIEGDECDPRGAFRLSDDTWNALVYAENGRPTEADKYRFRFSRIRSWLKPYVKRFCYLSLLGSGGLLKSGGAAFPYRLVPADRFISRRGYRSLDDLASPKAFEGVWSSLLRRPSSDDGAEGLLPASAVHLQQQTRPFWADLSIRFGSPLHVLPVTPHRKRILSETGSDKSRVIPDPVSRQLINKLALHRSKISLLNRFDHLRLCVLLLLICLGRRVDELLSAPKGTGPDGPLERYPCRHSDGDAAAALWFVMRPNKGGPSEYVYISPAWEDLAFYCVHQLIRYGDEVRQFAVAEEQHLLILVSTWNWTRGPDAKAAIIPDENQDFTRRGCLGGQLIPRPSSMKRRTSGLSFRAFRQWLSGKNCTDNPELSVIGVLAKWGITEDGTADGPIAKLCTHYGRHTRQSALALHSHLSPVVRQRDLNHRDIDMQVYYQHVIDEQNAELITKVVEQPLHGQSNEWLGEVLGISGQDEESHGSAKYQPGLVQLLTPRWKRLLEDNLSYFEPNRIPLGICDEADGPESCLTPDVRRQVRNSDTKVAAAPSSKTAQKASASPRKKRGSHSAERRQSSADDSGAIKSSDVLKRLRDRQKQVGGRRYGKSDEQR